MKGLLYTITDYGCGCRDVVSAERPGFYYKERCREHAGEWLEMITP